MLYMYYLLMTLNLQNAFWRLFNTLNMVFFPDHAHLIAFGTYLLLYKRIYSLLIQGLLNILEDYIWYLSLVTWYPTGRSEIKLLLLVFELTVSSRQKKWPLGRNVGHTGETRCWYLVTSGRRTPRGRREKPNDWLGPQNGSGDPFPSVEVNRKKGSFWAGSVAGRRTIAILLRVEDRRMLRREGPEFFKPVLKTKQSLVARERRKILQWNPVEK